ncbi:MAG: hypothetical protein EYC70_08635 [Planctomycetota bacterium]|nr:MAG: hypothetical protein EYC70_08635 [Planctomycetota bacterium]
MTRTLLLLLALLVVAGLLWLWQGGGAEEPAPAGGGETAVAPAEPGPAAPVPAARGAGAAPAVRSAAAAEAAADPAAEARDAAPARTRTLVARLVDEEERPIAGGTVGALGMNLQADEEDVIMDALRALEGLKVGRVTRVEATTGADGVARVALPHQEDWQWAVFGCADGTDFALTMLDMEIAGDEIDAGDLVVRPGTELEVRVTDESGAALAGADVWVTEQGFEWEHGRVPWRLLSTDEDGRCRFRHLSHQAYNVLAQRQGFVSAGVEDVKPHEEVSASRGVVLRRGLALRGQVIEEDGAPAAGIEIRLGAWSEEEGLGMDSPLELVSQGGRPWAVSDAGGRFEGAGLEDGRTYKLRATRDRIVWVESGPARAGDDVVLRLPAASCLTGRLLAADGGPAAGARLIARPGGQLHAWIDPSESLSADASGAFRLPLRPGRYRLAAWHGSGETLFEQDFDVHGVTDAGELRIPAGGVLELQVEDAAGRPLGEVTLKEADPENAFPDIDGEVEHAEVERRLREFEAQRRMRERAMLLRAGRADPETVAPGVLRWAGIEPGQHRFEVTAPGCPPQRFDAEIVPGQVTQHALRLGAGADLELMVRNADGTPARDTLVSLWPEGRTGPSWDFDQRLVGRPSPGGIAKFKDLSPGTYEVYEGFRYDDDQEPLRTLALAQGTNRAELSLPPRYSLVVSVAGPEGPVAGATVEAQRVDGGESFTWAGLNSEELVTDASGSCVLEELTPGRYRVQAARSGGYPATAQCTLEADRQQLVLRLEGLRIEGRVDNAPAECVVRLSRTVAPDDVAGAPQDDPEAMERFWREFGAQSAQAQCDRQGHFVFHDLPSGTYMLQADADGFEQPQPLEVKLEGQSRAGVVLTLQAEGRLRLRVTGLQVDSLSFGFTALAVAEDRPVSSIWIRQDGDYDFDGLMPGNYTLRVQRQEGFDSITVAEFAVSVSAHAPTVVEWDASRQP